MTIGVNCGHTASGAGYGAVGIIKESDHTRLVGRELMRLLQTAGVKVIDCTIDRTVTQNEYLSKVVELANREDLDWFISIHFNASASHTGQGAEVYTYKGRQYPDALDVCAGLAGLGLKNRGVKEGTGLYVIRKTKAKSMLIEVCFCDSQQDISIYNAAGGASGIAEAIFKGLRGYVSADKDTIIAGTGTNETPIMGNSVASAAQLNALLLSKNPNATDYLHLAEIFLSEGQKEGVRGDVAFCQTLVETGYFKFGGDVQPCQHNYAGIGATGGVPGLSFPDERTGIRAQIQHLKAYASTEPLVQECVDPRFKYVSRGSARCVEWLGIQENPQGIGWAAGAGYGKKILDILEMIIKE